MLNTKKIGISIVACVLGLVIMLPNSFAEARHMMMNNDAADVEVIRGTKIENGSEMTFQERINAILHPVEEVQQPADAEDDLVKFLEDESAIEGGPMASRAQCVKYLLSHNPHPRITVTPEELVSYYYEEGEREGIRPDVAFAQALKETGFFQYGGTVVPDQNNYCGLGTTSASVRGAYFPTAQMGVRAHIQHLKAYISQQEPQAPVVDPRYELVRRSYGTHTLKDWEELNGRWAVPGYGYGQSILSIHKNILRG